MELVVNSSQSTPLLVSDSITSIKSLQDSNANLALLQSSKASISVSLLVPHRLQQVSGLFKRLARLEVVGRMTQQRLQAK